MNIGNPQAVGQGHLTYNREVLAGLLNPGLAQSEALSQDARNRIEAIATNTSSPMGAYTSNSKGHTYLRAQIGQFIEERDGPAVKTDVDNIYLTNGASEGVRVAFKLLIRGAKDGVLVPIPQYPLYSAQIALDGGTMVPYYLDEDKCWGIDVDVIEKSIRSARDLGVTLRSMVVINPGNPTGNVLSRQDIEKIIKIAFENQMVIIADEVYQNNIYTEEAPFISIRKVLAEMGEPYCNSVELMSLHSVSKGYMGECGLRGGYMELHNFDEYALSMFYKLKSIELCSNTIGQAAASLMVDPPKKGRESEACVDQYWREYNEIENGLKERALMLTETFNDMENTNC